MTRQTAPAPRPEVGDRVRVVWVNSAWYGTTAVVTAVSPRGVVSLRNEAGETNGLGTRHVRVVEPAARQPEPAPAPDPHVAWGRNESDPCERGTYGCSVDHDAVQADTGHTGDCETW